MHCSDTIVKSVSEEANRGLVASESKPSCANNAKPVAAEYIESAERRWLVDDQQQDDEARIVMLQLHAD